MRVSFHNGIFTCKCSYHERHESKAAKFDYNGKNWVTTCVERAVRLKKYFDLSAKEFLEEFLLRNQKSIWNLDKYTPENKVLDEYQKESVLFALQRNHSYLALEQGLGKTPISVVIINAILSRFAFTGQAMVVVPPFLVTNWVNEIKAWQIKDYKIGVIRKGTDRPKDFDILIVADSILINENVFRYLTLKNKFCFDLLIVDEAHRYSNLEAKRTAKMFRPQSLRQDTTWLTRLAAQTVLLSGTPMRNRPKELYPALSRLAFNIIDYRGYYSYASRYCDGRIRKISHKKTIFDDSGSSNESELHEKIKPFMLVKKFKDYVTVPVTEQVTTIDGSQGFTTKSLEKLILKKHSVSELVGDTSIGDVAKYRRELSSYKVRATAEYIKDQIFMTDESFILFGWHTDAIIEMGEKLKEFKPEIIYGATSNKKRDVIAERFMEGGTKVLIANIGAMLGLNLQKGSRGIFFESSWVPSDNEQAISRMVRRGQNKKVLIEHLVIAKTLDEYVMRRVLEKSKVINNIIKG